MAVPSDVAAKPGDVLKQLVDHPNMPSFKDTISKLASLPGASALRGMGLQMLRMQEQMLNLHLAMVTQAIEALENQSDPAYDEPDGDGTTRARKRKIAVS